MEPDIIIALILIVVLGVIVIAISADQNRKLEDPANTEVVFRDEIPKIAVLNGPGEFLLRTYRQSGNLQKDDIIYNDPDEVVRAAVSTFARAKIPYVMIESNTPTKLAFRRPFHDHRGRQEGKKIGSIEIRRI